MYARKGFNRFTLMIAGKRRGVKIFLRRGSADNGNMNPVGVAYVSPRFRERIFSVVDAKKS